MNITMKVIKFIDESCEVESEIRDSKHKSDKLINEYLSGNVDESVVYDNLGL